MMDVLEHTKWQNFKPVLLKAQIACENTGYDSGNHFTGAIKMVAIGSDANAKSRMLMCVYGRSYHHISHHKSIRLIEFISDVFL
jgi:hypothetical protein